MRVKRLMMLPVILGVFISPLFALSNKASSSISTKPQLQRVTRNNDPVTHTFTKATSLDDNRGTYLIVNETNNKVFNSSLANPNVNNNSAAVTISDHTISDNTGDLLDYAVSLVKSGDEGSYLYYVKLANGKYLYYDGTASALNQSDAPTTNAILFDGDHLKMKPTSGSGSGTKFAYDSSKDKFAFYGGSKAAVYLYRLDYTPDTAIDNYVSALSTFKSNCNGVSMPSVSLWDAANSGVSSLSVDAQGYLGNVTYIHDVEEDGSLKDVIDLYDYVVSKYSGVYSDYLKRKGNPNFPNYSFAYKDMSGDNNLSSSDNTLLIILASTITVIALTSFIILRRRSK